MANQQIISSTLVLIILVATNVVAQNENYQPVMGRVHPDFELPSIDEPKRVKLSDFRGKKLLLFHFASW